MEANICPRCGETLKVQGDVLTCLYCGASYERQTAEKAAYLLKNVLDESKMERLANCKRHLWDATHEKYPSKEKVCDAAKTVLSLHAEDFLANVYLHSHDRDPAKTNLLLAESEVSIAEADEAFRWLLPSLSSRMVGPLHDFVDRHFSNQDRINKINLLEAEAGNIQEGIYEPSLPRDVFLCYSSRDMAKVVEIMDTLERNGLTCFAAFRNLRHGKGAAEDYLSAIQTAMRSCEVLVFLSSEGSRSMDCDALKVELPYLTLELPGKPRIEFLLEDYDDTPYLVRKTLKKAFPSQERCTNMDDLLDRVVDAIEAKENPVNAQIKIDPSAELERLKKEAMDRLLAQQKEDERKRREEEDRKKKEAELERLMKERLEKEEKARQLSEEENERKKVARDAKKNLAPRREGDFVYYGLYPQSEIKDPQTLSALHIKTPASNGCIAFDGNEYVKVDGKYFLVEPIKWRILERAGGKAKLLSDALLDCHRFDESNNIYASSEIRTWLNNDFKKTAFPDGGTHIILQQGDAVFLPSEKDMTSSYYGFESEINRQCKPTSYAKAKGSYINDSNGCGWYWTATESFYSKMVHDVVFDGNVQWCLVNNMFRSVRPAIWIKLD